MERTGQKKRVVDYVDVDAGPDERIAVLVEGIRSYAPGTKDIAFTGRAAGVEGSFHISGKGEAVLPGEVAACYGRWKFDPNLGHYFAADEVRETAVTTTAGIIGVLKQSNSPIGKKLCQRLQELFGDKLPDNITDARALQMAGVPIEKAKAIATRWNNRKKYGKALCLLHAHGIPRTRIDSVVNRFGEDTVRVAFTQPYRLAEEVKGIGFMTADRMALSTGLAQDARDRVHAALKFGIAQYAGRGHCCIPEASLSSNTANMLAIRPDIVEAELERMCNEGRLIDETMSGGRFLYLPGTHACEIEVGRDIADRIGAVPFDGDVDKVVAQAEADAGLSLHINQQEAVKKALMNRLVVITGGPGVGKTATMKVLIDAFKIARPELRIMLTAPTGRAAKRLSESTGIEASTIHRALEFSPENQGFVHDQTNPLQADLIVVDEASMIGIWLMRDLLRALDKGAFLVLVGDVDQLPSVESGNVLSDIIDTGIVPTTRLTKVFRQSGDSTIAINAQGILAGRIPTLTPPRRGSDMWGVTVGEPTEAADAVHDLVTRILPRQGFDPMTDVQILTPGHNNETGTRALNDMLQAALNPRPDTDAFVRLPHGVARLGDRVMQTTNNYDLGAFNGDVGRVTAIGGFDPRNPSAGGTGMRVDYDGIEIDYSVKEAEQLVLAYATTIHKSQGSEYPVVIIVLTRAHFNMLQRNLIYTAITRARKICCIVADTHAIRDSVSRTDAAKRWTSLTTRVREHRAIDMKTGSSGREPVHEPERQPDHPGTPDEALFGADGDAEGFFVDGPDF